MTISAIFTLLACAALRWGLTVPWLAAYLLAVNATVAGLYLYDKRAAERAWLRVPERVLHIVTAIGGSPAALVCQAALRHKSVKRSFRLRFWTICAAQVILMIAYCWLAKPWK